MSSISLRNVIKRYGTGKTELQVIHGVNAEIAQGETHSDLALTVAMALPWANEDDKAVLNRFLKGSYTERDRFDLQMFAVRTHNKFVGLTPSI